MISILPYAGELSWSSHGPAQRQGDHPGLGREVPPQGLQSPALSNNVSRQTCPYLTISQLLRPGVLLTSILFPHSSGRSLAPVSSQQSCPSCNGRHRLPPSSGRHGEMAGGGQLHPPPPTPPVYVLKGACPDSLPLCSPSVMPASWGPQPHVPCQSASWFSSSWEQRVPVGP